MTPSGSIALQLALSVVMVILTSYVAGRVHQWYRHGFERDVAYREGYNQASHTLFQLAVRNHPAAVSAASSRSSLVSSAESSACDFSSADSSSGEVADRVGAAHVRGIVPIKHFTEPFDRAPLTRQ